MRWALAVLLLAPTACDQAGGLPSPSVPGRPDDGLLAEPALQAVVDRQVARDGPGLVEALSDPEARVRARAAFALASVQDPASTGALAAALQDPSPPVRMDAAFALGRVGGDGVGSALEAALEVEPDREVRRHLVQALGMAGDAAAVDALARYHEARLEAGIVMALARALVRGVESEAAVERVGSSITHPDPEVRMAAAYLMARAENPAVWYAYRRRARIALTGWDKDEPAAMWVIQGLGRSGDFYSRGLLQEWARTAEDWRVRVNAIRALSLRFPDVSTVDVFLDALDDPYRHVAIAAVEGMGEFALPPDQLDRIRAWVEAHPDEWRITGRLVGVLAINGDDETALAWMDEVPLSDLGRWRLGIEALGYVAGEGAVRMLQRLLESPHTEIARRAMESLANRWKRDRSVPDTHDTYWAIFSEALRDDDPGVVYPAAEAVVDPAFGEDGAVPLLRDFWARMGPEVEPRARVAVLDALGAAADPRGEDVVREALLRPEPAVRSAAAEALTAITGGPVEMPPPAFERPTPEPHPSLPDFLGERIDWDRLRDLGPHPLLHLETERGEVVVRLDADEAPWTVQTVATLAGAGMYDGVPFHRVVPNFVIQGGDFTDEDGTGSPGFQIGTELTRIPFLRGVIGMASSGTDTESSQYFITHSPQPHLDGGYTAFGYVLRGIDVVDRILIGDRVDRAWVEPDR
jgi:peptidylprolyl isomerase